MVTERQKYGFQPHQDDQSTDYPLFNKLLVRGLVEDVEGKTSRELLCKKLVKAGLDPKQIKIAHEDNVSNIYKHQDAIKHVFELKQDLRAERARADRAENELVELRERLSKRDTSRATNRRLTKQNQSLREQIRSVTEERDRLLEDRDAHAFAPGGAPSAFRVKLRVKLARGSDEAVPALKLSNHTDDAPMLITEPWQPLKVTEQRISQEILARYHAGDKTTVMRRQALLKVIARDVKQVCRLSRLGPGKIKSIIEKAKHQTCNPVSCVRAVDIDGENSRTRQQSRKFGISEMNEEDKTDRNRRIDDLIELARNHGDQWFTPQRVEVMRVELMAMSSRLFNFFGEIRIADARCADATYSKRVKLE